MHKLLVATQNRHKLEEYRDLLYDIGDIEWLCLTDIGLEHLHVEESGTTFQENARLKAEAYGESSGLMTLADDSGLVVPSLNGEPGVYSARYGGPSIQTDAQRYQLLLQNLADKSDRTAYFVCVIALYVPYQGVQFFEGRVDGYIAFAPRGTNGFGYDPVFELPNGRTMAELSPNEKHELSHRGRAVQLLLPELKYILSNN
ncbi:MAG: non-canonical purine NTP pyrophosphatase, RdgB/HAM1 family [Phototrophicales bacterium]|nr:MAG: non-canonical purine NTP pyrophosphatase, RdgB/HAM1 family [Phototrophicales bacterium]